MPATIEPSKLINNFNKKAMEESIIEELSKKFEAVSLAKFGRCGPKGREVYRCVWCDNFNHSRRECTYLQDVVALLHACMEKGGTTGVLDREIMETEEDKEATEELAHAQECKHTGITVNDTADTRRLQV